LLSGAEPGNAGEDDRKPSLPALREFYDRIIARWRLARLRQADHWAVALPISRARPALAATMIVRHLEERLLAMPRRSLESASRLRDQARRWRASADAEPSPTVVAPLTRA